MVFASMVRQRGSRAASACVLVLSACLAGLLPPTAPTASAQLAAQRQSVLVQGNQRVEAGTILSYLGLTPGQPFTSEDLSVGVSRLLETGLFRDVRTIPSGNQVIVQVVENPTIGDVDFEGNDALSDEDLQQIIRLRPRLPYSPSAAEADARAIQDVYRRTGRFGAVVQPVAVEQPGNRVDLVFRINEGGVTGVSDISFVGNQAFSDRRLRRVIETRESGLLSFLRSTDIYDPDRLELDKELLRNFYFERGYADFNVVSATAELAPDRDGFNIVFNVVEGQRYRFGDVAIEIAARGLRPEHFAGAIPAGLTGDVYDASLVEEIVDELTDVAGQRGFAFVQVRPRARKDEVNRTVSITFEITEGPRVFVERIEIEGNTQTLDRVIRRQIELVEGDPFDARKIREAQRRIRALNYFSRVEIVPEEGSAPDRAILRIRVEEQPTGSLSFGIGYASNAGPIGNIAVTERNFLGRGQLLNLQLTAAGDTQVYDFSFTEPAFLDRDLAVGLRAFYIDDDRSDESSFEIARMGFGPTVSFPLAEDTRLSLRYELRQDDIEASPSASPAIIADEGTRLTSSVGYALTYDRRNDVIEPTSGYLLRGEQDFAGFGGDARYVRSEVTAKTWTGFFDDRVVASLEGELGAIYGIADDIRLNERFFVGGQSLRGFAAQGIGPRDVTTGDALGGNYYAVTRFEVSFPLGLPEDLGIFGGLFVDAGTLFGLDGTRFGAGGVPIDDDPALRVAAGALLFVGTPFGPLEMSFGMPIVEEEFDESELFRLSIGTRF